MLPRLPGTLRRRADAEPHELEAIGETRIAAQDVPLWCHRHVHEMMTIWDKA
jgi:hypothetical protein